APPAPARAGSAPPPRRPAAAGDSRPPEEAGDSRPPEEALRPGYQDAEEEQEPNHLPVRPAEAGGAERLRAAQHEPAEERAERGAEPGQHDHDQRLQRPLEPDRRTDRVPGGDQRPRRARQRGAEPEGEQVRAADVDPDQERRLPVLGGGADRLPPPVPLQERVEQRDQRD